ncbi:hypothetical protein STTU_p0073 (plasmid) [Streptomyces sp. Tu6071]|nr:hypothetical protein STTU_p0073 [Streptomyces sp. Tu6071]
MFRAASRRQAASPGCPRACGILQAGPHMAGPVWRRPRARGDPPLRPQPGIHSLRSRVPSYPSIHRS